MATILCNSATIVIVCTRPLAIPLAMITMRKTIQGFPLLSYMGLGLHLVAHSSAIIETLKSHPIMPVFQTPPHTSEQLHGTHHTAVLRQHVLHREENAITQLHIASSPHWIRFGLIHPYHSKMTAIVALNSSFR